MIEMIDVEPLNLTIVIDKGIVTFEEITSFFNDSVKSGKYIPRKYLINDLREAEFDFNINKFLNLIENQNKNKNFKRSENVVYLCLTPKETAYTTVSSKIHSQSAESSVFYTLDSALKSLGLLYSKKQICKYIKDDDEFI